MSNMAEQDIKQQIESTLLDQEIEECAGKRESKRYLTCAVVLMVIIQVKDTNQDLKKQSKKTLRRIEYATVSLEDAAQVSHSFRVATSRVNLMQFAFRRPSTTFRLVTST